MPNALPYPLPLFPLSTVLFPGGLLPLKVFEARYLDLMSRCMRRGEGFGVVCLSEGAEVDSAPDPGADAGAARPASNQAGQARRQAIEMVGVLARLEEVDAPQPGILLVRCVGTSRFRLRQPPQRQPDGLWVGHADPLAEDPSEPPGEAMAATVDALQQASAALMAEGHKPFAGPLRWDDAGWVANRWCELLPLPLTAKQRLMALDDPGVRLQLVDEFLRSRKVIGAYRS